MVEKGYGASVIGKLHVKLRIPNQDSYLIENNKNYTLAIVCDGLGSKKYSHIGSKKLCLVIKKEINKCFKNKNLDIEKLIPLIKKKWKNKLWPIKPQKADTTCIFILISNKNIIMCQIGDGLCVLTTNNSIQILSKKDDDFSNETSTFYKSKICDWSVKVIKKDDEEVYKALLCTDGISEDLKYDFLKEFINDLSNNIEDENTTNNKYLLDIITNWPNKYSNDDKTMVVIK